MNDRFSKEQWRRLRALRIVFLGESASRAEDYWPGECGNDTELLELYDASFGERIGTKWDAIIAELKTKKLYGAFQSLPIVDLGCGSGIASRRWLTAFPPAAGQKILLVDRSKSAMAYAQQKLLALGRECDIQLSPKAAEIPQNRLVLASHVINELAPAAVNWFQKILSQSAAFVWVEPGAKETATKVVNLREALRATHDFIAPCPHNESCGMLVPKNERHWCHHFAKPPGDVFQSAFWRRFSTELKIDLRSLPTSYLVGVKKGATNYPLPPNRVIGRARHYKGYALALLCRTGGVGEGRVMSRHFPDTVDRLGDHHFCESIEPTQWEPIK